jgi:hypothetical protein
MAESPRTRQPEREMALRALVPGLPAAGIALVAGSFVGLGVGVSAAIGVLSVLLSFVVNALALGWARTVSMTAIQVVAFGGFLVRMAFVAGVFLSLKASASWFSPAAFGGALMALIPIALYEAHLTRRGPVAEAIAFADVPVKDRR